MYICALLVCNALVGIISRNANSDQTYKYPQITAPETADKRAQREFNSQRSRHAYCLCATEDQFKENNKHIASNDRNLEVLNRIVQIDGLHHKWRLCVWVDLIPSILGKEPWLVDN